MAAITKRNDKCRLMTQDGVEVRLIGLIDDCTTIANGFSIEVNSQISRSIRNFVVLCYIAYTYLLFWTDCTSVPLWVSIYMEPFIAE